MESGQKTPLISIIITTYNEEGNILPLIKNIERACSNISHEIIIVDDGSIDETRKEIQAIVNLSLDIKPIFLKRNFGQTAALAAGIDHAQGDTIITMDGDGQNDPDDIPRLLEELNKGIDVVSGWRKDRKDNLLTRNIPSWIANTFISLVTGVPLHDYGCTLKAYKKSVITPIQLSGEMHRFLPAWCAWMGGKVSEIPVKHHPRTVGKSKYGLGRTFKVLIDLMTVKFFSGYLTKPNYLFSGIGLVVLFLGFIAGGLAVYDKIGPDMVPHLRYPLMLLSVFFGLVSIFLILMGFMAELLVRLYFQSCHQKPYRLTDE